VKLEVCTALATTNVIRFTYDTASARWQGAFRKKDWEKALA
jgi:hypothetical protein